MWFWMTTYFMWPLRYSAEIYLGNIDQRYVCGSMNIHRYTVYEVVTHGGHSGLFHLGFRIHEMFIQYNCISNLFTYIAHHLSWLGLSGIFKLDEVEVNPSLSELPLNGCLTHWGREKMAAIFQTTFSSAFSWMKMFKFRLKFHWSLFPRVQLTIFQHWFR